MEHPPYFPLFVDLDRKRILVAGAGTIAARRVQTLVPFGPRITVIAPEIHPALETAAAAGEITVLRRPCAPEDADGADLVLAATDDHALNARIGARCRARGIPVNVCDDPKACDFFFPGVARERDLVIGVTASGTDHKAARALTQELRAYLKNRNK